VATTQNRRTGHKTLHLVSAFATNSRLVFELVGPACRDHDEKHSMNRLGSMQFMTQRSQSAQGMPKWNWARLEGHVSAGRGVVPGGVRHDRERRRLRRQAHLAFLRGCRPDCRIGRSASRRAFRLSRSVSSRMCYIIPRVARRRPSWLARPKGIKLAQIHPRPPPDQPSNWPLLEVVASFANLLLSFFNRFFNDQLSSLGCNIEHFGGAAITSIRYKRSRRSWTTSARVGGDSIPVPPIRSDIG
jgi:hypothetical protein